ncbi:hypothetical protein C8R46DRAFT_1217356 [Mycena filopes]|nr:hypothetical protein C8R46DRAFT_1217356 [Mycena filopes]
MPLHRPRASLPSNQQRFDAISLTSPSQRNDPAFSRDPALNHAHPVEAQRRERDVIGTSAPDLFPRSLLPLVVANPDPTLDHQPFPQEKRVPARYEADYYTSSQGSQSSLTLPPSNASSASTYSLLISAPSTLHSQLPTPTAIPSELPTEEDPSVQVASPLSETFVGLDADKRPISPPPDYEIIAPPPRPIPFRIDSAPELRHIEPLDLPDRSATAPIPAAPPARRQPTNDRRLQAAYDLDRIDELDESSPLGVALHHEGPFQAIASVLKGPSALGNQSMAPQPRGTKTPKPNGGSLGIVPGQVVPRNFPYNQPAHPAFRSEFNNNSPQASTSYIPPQPQSHMRPPPPHQRPNHDPRWAPSPVQYPQPHFDAHPFPQSQYDPVDELPQTDQNFAQIRNPYYPDMNHPPPPSHHAYYSSGDDSAAYGGIEEDPTRQRDRRSAPAVPSASRVQPGPYYAPQNGGDPNNNFQPRRHSAQAGHNHPPPDPRFTPPPDGYNPAIQHNPNPHRQPAVQAGRNHPSPDPRFTPPPDGYNPSNIQHNPNFHRQPMAGFIDPRIFQNREQPNAGQNGHSSNPPSMNPRLVQQSYPPPPQSGGHNANLPPQDRMRPSSFQPQPTPGHVAQQQPMAEHDPRRRASYQSVQRPPPGAAPVDLGRQQFDRERHIAGMMQDRPQSIAPSTVTTVNRRGPLPQHIPKNLVMPTPLQQSTQLPSQTVTRSYPADHYLPSAPPAKFNPSQQAQPTRAQTIQMVQDRDGGRQVLKKRASVVVQPSLPMPPKPCSEHVSATFIYGASTYHPQFSTRAASAPG